MDVTNHLAVHRRQSHVRLQRQMILPLITLVIILTITFFVSIAKGSVNEVYGSGLPEVGSNAVKINDTGLNQSESRILLTIYQVFGLSEKKLEEGKSAGAIYFQYLKNQLNSSQINIDAEAGDKIFNLISELNGIMRLEKTKDPEQMSIDGKEFATYIENQIYRLCGLSLISSMEGEIVSIADKNGKIIYSMDRTPQGYFNLYALLITLFILTALMSFCVIIARKNQLYIKDVKYDGFKEKGFA